MSVPLLQQFSLQFTMLLATRSGFPLQSFYSPKRRIKRIFTTILNADFVFKNNSFDFEKRTEIKIKPFCTTYTLLILYYLTLLLLVGDIQFKTPFVLLRINGLFYLGVPLLQQFSLQFTMLLQQGQAFRCNLFIRRKGA